MAPKSRPTRARPSELGSTANRRWIQAETGARSPNGRSPAGRQGQSVPVEIAPVPGDEHA